MWRMPRPGPRLIWVFAGRTDHIVGCVMRRLSFLVTEVLGAVQVPLNSSEQSVCLKRTLLLPLRVLKVRRCCLNKYHRWHSVITDSVFNGLDSLIEQSCVHWISVGILSDYFSWHSIRRVVRTKPSSGKSRQLKDTLSIKIKLKK